MKIVQNPFALRALPPELNSGRALKEGGYGDDSYKITYGTNSSRQYISTLFRVRNNGCLFCF